MGEPESTIERRRQTLMENLTKVWLWSQEFDPFNINTEQFQIPSHLKRILLNTNSRSSSDSPARDNESRMNSSGTNFGHRKTSIPKPSERIRIIDTLSSFQNIQLRSMTLNSDFKKSQYVSKRQPFSPPIHAESQLSP